jgi:hypothetical protein
MRKIKFRAWDSEEERFIFTDQSYDDHWFQFEDNKTLMAFGLSEINHGPPEDRVKSRKLESVQQFTGLFDKGGKEIYEGDILHWMTLTFPIIIEDYHGYRFMFGKDNLCRAYAIEGEVIGNIYEEKELSCTSAEGVKGNCDI